MAYIGQLIGALTSTTLGRSAPPPRRSRPTRRHGELASRTVAVCTALAIAVTLAVAMGLASSAVARPAVQAPPPNVVNAAAPGPHLSGLRGMQDAAAAPSEDGGLPWGAAVIGSGVALGLIGLAISRARSRTRTGPAALSQ